ncbi:MAG: zinc finger-like domain-containing protein [Planctomycetes bacterium]|nr:zinc finger-like domain-containing protein [Planctomycetota bacterium]
MILLLMMVLGQDPEQALASYAEAREKFVQEADLAAELQRIVAEAEDAISTEGLRRRRREKRHAQASVVSYRVLESRRDGDTATLVVEEQLKAPDGARRKKLAFAKAGNRWLIAREFDGCPACQAKGTCTWCDGRGEANRKPCPRCKGKKRCDTCDGAQWIERSFAHGITPLAARRDFAPRTDTSSARATAEAFADALTAEQIRLSAAMRRFFESSLALLKAHFTEDVAREAQEALRKAVEDGAKALQAYVPSVDVKTDGDRATAIVSAPPGPLGNERRQIALRKTDGRWLVDEVKRECGWCRGRGVCAACQGKAGKLTCLYCNNSGRCEPCEGAGFTD